jgi:hypothetical protein
MAVGKTIPMMLSKQTQSVVKNHSDFDKTPMHGQTELPDWIGQKVVRNA